MAKGTLIQKIIDAHMVDGSCTPGGNVSIKIDQTLTQDATGTMAYLELEAMRQDRVATEISLSYVDHNMLQNGPENRNDHIYLQSVAAAKGVLFSPPGNGICHQVHLERFGIPGKTLLGSDSHTPTGGGLGMLAIGAGGLDVARAMAGKPFRTLYPRIIGVNLFGKLQAWCTAKDVILTLLSILTTKGNVGCAVEYFGSGVKELSVPERATITNMGAELGVTSSVFPSDERTKHFLEAQGRGGSYVALAADADAEYDRIIEINLNDVIPLAACPSSPDNIKSIDDLKGLKVGQVIIGSCTNSSYRDLAMVATVLKGRKVASDVSLALSPGSRQVLEMIARNGMLADMIAAGARILETGCAACIGQGQSPANGTVTVRTFNRNFAGRTGTKGDQSYLVSPESAVAAALTGKFVDPRTLDIEYPEIADVENFLINDNMFITSSDKGSDVEIIRKETIGQPPLNTPLPDFLNGVAVLKVGDKITTDHISPAGVHLKLRSNIPAYAQVAFECFTEAGKPSFAERAAKVRDEGKHGIIVARESYGQGSSREHAAICPMYLGIKAVIAVTIERILRANLVNFGIIPLIFANPDDYDQLNEGDVIEIADCRTQLEKGDGKMTAAVNGKVISLIAPDSPEDIAAILAGGVLNL